MSEMSTLPENSTFSHSWTITDLSGKLVSSVEHPRITSLSFPSTSPNTKSPVFRLSLYPKGINVNFSDFLSIGFGAVSLIENDEKITVRYRVSLIDSKGERRNTKEWLYIFSSSKRLSVFGRFITRSELFCPSNGLLTDDKLVIHCEGTVLGEPTALDYANTNLDDLKFIASSQPNLMVDMLYSLATKHRLTYYSPDGFPNFEIQNQVDETFSYSYRTKMYDDEIFTWTQSKYTKRTEELKLLSRREMLHLLHFWMVSGKHSDLSIELQGDQDKVLDVHKIFLQNRSSEFDVLLQQNHRVSISDVSSEVFDQLIHYIYTGKVPLLKKFSNELLKVSCEYGFDVLKQMCELTLCDEITTENVLILVNEASMDLLKQACLEYITDHATELMFDLTSLKPDLIEEMCRKLALKHQPTESHHTYDQIDIPNFAIQNQVDETFSYTHFAAIYEFSSYSAWSISKYNTRSIHELKQLSRQEMLDLLSFWMVSGKQADLSLVLQDEKVLNVHKIVLLNRSSSFDVLLNEIVAKKNNQMSSEVFDQLIHYLYTGKVALLKEYQYDLLNVSHEYGFDVLKQMSELAICEQITTENVIHLLILASADSGDLLKRAALEYITDHAAELLFELSDSLKPELIEEMYLNLALKNALNEAEDKLVYENFQQKLVFDELEESLSYTHHKMYNIFNEFTYRDYVNDYNANYGSLIAWFQSPEFCALENSSLKFKLCKISPDNYNCSGNRHFNLVVKDDAPRSDLSEPPVSLIHFKMTLSWENESKCETLSTCDGVEYLKITSNYTRLINSIRFENLDKLDYYNSGRYFEDRSSKKFISQSKWGRNKQATFKICSEIVVLNDITALDLSPIQGLTQLELAQSRKHLLECINSTLLKSDDDDKRQDVTLVVCGTELKAHKLFLAQSPVLEALVTLFHRIPIADFSIETFETFVQYLYTGKVQSLDKYAEELLIVASRYKLETLEQMCQLALKQLSDQLNESNVESCTVESPNVKSRKRKSRNRKSRTGKPRPRKVMTLSID